MSPLLRPDSKIQDATLKELKDLDAKYVRHMPYGTHPRLSIAELAPPSDKGTSWDFKLIDELVIPYLEASKDREPILCFDSIPAWMFKNWKNIEYPSDPNAGSIGYLVRDSALLDPTGQQAAEYFARVFSWYTQGGFTDENGKYHRSGHHYRIPWWEVLNEFDAQGTAEEYLRIYDATVAAIRKIEPNTKFVGLAASDTTRPETFEYFLDPRNHRPDTPLDMVSYHFYSMPTIAQGVQEWQYTVFDQADGYLSTVKYIDAIRQRLSPSTLINVDEMGNYLFQYWDKWAFPDAPKAAVPIPPEYWNLSGALHAYLYMSLAQRNVDVATASWLVGFNESGVLMDSQDGKPNARFQVVKLIKNNFGPGDKLVDTTALSSGGGLGPVDVAAQGFVTSTGRKMLLINKRRKAVTVSIGNQGMSGSTVIDVSSGGKVVPLNVGDGTLHLKGFAVVVLTVIETKS